MKRSPRTAIVAGSYDPVTAGHLYLIDYAARHYQNVRAVIFVNESTNYLFPLEKRLELLRAACAKYDNVTVDCDGGMQYLYAKKHGATRAVRGWRNDKDLAYEKESADFNRTHLPGYETVLLRTPKKLAHISSTLVREKLAAGEDLAGLVPDECLKLLSDSPGKS